MPRHAFSISPVLALTALVGALATPVAAQKGQLFNQKISIYVETNTFLHIYDGAGNELHVDGIQPDGTTTTVDWRGDLDPGDGNCDCDWQIDWDSAATDVLYFEIDPDTGAPIRYAYSPAASRLYGSFWTPYGGSHISQDIDFFVDAQGHVSASGGGPTFESFFSGSYVIPYDLGAYCAVYPMGGCSNYRVFGFFLSPVECVPGSCVPTATADSPPFTFASEGTAVCFPRGRRRGTSRTSC